MFTKIYCQNLFLLFILTVIFITTYAVLNVIFNNSKIFRAVGFICIFISLWGILSFTLFNREVSTYGIELVPFYGLFMPNPPPEYYRTLFLNCLLYIPFGTFLPYMLSRKYEILNIIVTVLLSLVISITIESLQYYFSIGVFETDDIIFNTLGGFVGASGYLLFNYLKKKLNIKIKPPKL